MALACTILDGLLAVFSERELTDRLQQIANVNVNSRSYLLSPVHLSVICLSVICLSSVTLVRHTQAVEIFGQYLYGTWYLGHPLTDIHRKFYGDHPR